MQKFLTPALLALSSLSSVAGTFTNTTITGDADSGISGDKAYTHAIDVFDGANRTINGAVFTGSGGGGNPATNNYSTTGLNNGFTGFAPGVAGNTGGMMNNFLYNGNPATYTLNNLRVGETYTTTIYNAAFGGPGGRIHNVTASDGGSLPGYDQNATAGSALNYTFTATSNTITYTMTPVNPGDTWHHYGFSNHVAVPGYKALVTDNFYAPSNPDTNNLNFNLAARQGGSLVTTGGVKSWVASGNTQVGNPTGSVDAGNYLLDAFGATSALDYNFNGSASNGGLSISFDLAPNIGNVGADNWEALNLGAASVDKNGGVNGGQTHFGILFRGQGTIQAFDGSSVLTGTEPIWGPGGVTTALNHFELIITDVDGNPFDGVGSTKIDVYANGNPVYTFTKGGGGYADNYLNFQASHIGGIDNLVIAQIPEPATFALGGLAAFALVRRRRAGC
jgi:hypothetical protein